MSLEAAPSLRGERSADALATGSSHNHSMGSEATPWAGCQVCGHTDHTFRHHLDEVEVPDFVHVSVQRLRHLDRTSDIHPLVKEVADMANLEQGGRKAWALWLGLLLRELEEAADAPEVAAEIENFLIGGYSS